MIRFRSWFICADPISFYFISRFFALSATLLFLGQKKK